MNDQITTFSVNPDMLGFLNSSDFPATLKPGIQFGMTGHKGPSGSVTIAYNGTDIVQEHSIPLPASCPRPKVIETARANDAQSSSVIRGGRLTLQLRVKPSAPEGPHNLIGVRIACS